MALPGVRTLDTESRHPDVTANMHSDDLAASPPTSPSLCPRFALPLLGGGWVGWVVGMNSIVNTYKFTPTLSCGQHQCQQDFLFNALLFTAFVGKRSSVT